MGKKVLSLRIPEELFDQIETESASQGVPYRIWVLNTLTQAIDKTQKGQIKMSVNSQQTQVKMSLGRLILTKGQELGIDVFTTAFQPSDLGIESSDHGSFSDHCLSDTTKSSKYNRSQCLMPVAFDSKGRPTKYLLIQDQIRTFNIRESRMSSQHHDFAGLDGYGFEVLGLHGDPDLALICIKAYSSEEMASTAAKKLIESQYKTPPAEKVILIIEDTFLKTWIKIHVDSGGAMVAGRRVMVPADSPFRGNTVVLTSFENSLKEAQKKLGRKF